MKYQQIAVTLGYKLGAFDISVVPELSELLMVVSLSTEYPMLYEVGLRVVLKWAIVNGCIVFMFMLLSHAHG